MTYKLTSEPLYYLVSTEMINVTVFNPELTYTIASLDSAGRVETRQFDEKQLLSWLKSGHIVENIRVADGSKIVGIGGLDIQRGHYDIRLGRGELCLACIKLSNCPNQSVAYLVINRRYEVRTLTKDTFRQEVSRGHINNFYIANGVVKHKPDQKIMQLECTNNLPMLDTYRDMPIDVLINMLLERGFELGYDSSTYEAPIKCASSAYKKYNDAVRYKTLGLYNKDGAVVWFHTYNKRYTNPVLYYDGTIRNGLNARSAVVPDRSNIILKEGYSYNEVLVKLELIPDGFARYEKALEVYIPNNPWKAMPTVVQQQAGSVINAVKSQYPIYRFDIYNELYILAMECGIYNNEDVKENHLDSLISLISMKRTLSECSPSFTHIFDNFLYHYKTDLYELTQLVMDTTKCGKRRMGDFIKRGQIT